MTDVTREDVREVLAYERALLPVELRGYHDAWHEVTGLHARVDQGRVPDRVEAAPTWVMLAEPLGDAERAIVDACREEHAALIAEYDVTDSL